MVLGPGPTADKGSTEIKGPGAESPDYLITAGQLLVSSYSEENLNVVKCNTPSLYRPINEANVGYRNKRNNCEVHA